MAGSKGLNLDPISKELRMVDEEIIRSVSSTNTVLREVALYVLTAGGKRIRPALGITAYLAAGGKDVESVIPLAAAVELIHTSTLLHDDIIDGSDMRRGRPSAHKKFGLSAAIVTGDFLFSLAFSLCSSYGPKVIRITVDACKELAEAEMLQTTPWQEYTEELSLTIAKRKTGSLMAAGMEIGGVVVGASSKDKSRLKNYGYCVGTAFQIIDDCLDFSMDGSSGKPLGRDILSGKATLPILHALSHCKKNERALLERFLSSSKDDGSLGDVVRLLERTGSLEYARAKAMEYSDVARKELKNLKDSVYRTLLEDITQYILNRRN